MLQKKQLFRKNKNLLVYIYRQTNKYNKINGQYLENNNVL